MEMARLTVPCFAIEDRPKEIWKHKIFCILSSQFNAERAALIAQAMVDKIPFFDPEISTFSIKFLRLLDNDVGKARICANGRRVEQGPATDLVGIAPENAAGRRV